MPRTLIWKLETGKIEDEEFKTFTVPGPSGVVVHTDYARTAQEYAIRFNAPITSYRRR